MNLCTKLQGTRASSSGTAARGTCQPMILIYSPSSSPSKFSWQSSFNLARSTCSFYSCYTFSFAIIFTKNSIQKEKHISYLFASFWYHDICILSRSSRTDVFLDKVFLKISQNPQENTCNGVSFLSTACNFINEKSLAIFAKSSIVDFRLGYKDTSVLPPDLKPSYKDFLL